MLFRAASLASGPRCFGCRKTGSWLCPGCTDELTPPARPEPITSVDRISIPWAYEKTARDLVLALKLRARRPAATVLAAGIARTLQAGGTRVEVITWVPGRATDIRIRGFDHAALIASELGALIGLPVVGSIERTMDRPDQTTLSGPARRTNLHGAFVARSGAREVLLVDDLVTTGATATACTRALKAAGAGYVELAAGCRA